MQSRLLIRTAADGIIYGDGIREGHTRRRDSEARRFTAAEAFELLTDQAYRYRALYGCRSSRPETREHNDGKTGRKWSTSTVVDRA